MPHGRVGSDGSTSPVPTAEPSSSWPGWLTHRGVQPEQVTVSSKWGYTYTADWKVDAEVPEVKDHSAAALARQWPETEALLGPWLRLYQVHSATLESGILDDARDPAKHWPGSACLSGSA